MSGSRALFFAILLCFAGHDVPAFANQALLAQESTPQGAECEWLLGGPPANLRPSARRFLAILELGLRNFFDERPVYLRNLDTALQSDLPFNPLMNIHTLQASALARSADMLVVDLTHDWPLIQEWIQDRLTAAHRTSEARGQDIRQTQVVVNYEPFYFYGKNGAFGYDFESSPGPIFIMQTDSHYFIAGEVSTSGKHYHDVGVFRISKTDSEVSLVAWIDTLLVGQQIDFWSRDGLIYGFGRRGDKVFQLDPNTGKLKWSRFENSETHRILRVPGTTELVGIVFAGDGRVRSSHPDGIKGTVSKFNSDRLSIQKPGIPFVIPSAESIIWASSKPWSGSVSSFADRRSGNGWIGIANTIRTDGERLAYADGSEAWLSFKPMDRLRVRFTKHPGRNSQRLVDMEITEVTAVYSKRKPFADQEPRKVAVPNGKSALAQFQHQKGDSSYEFDCELPLASGNLLCHVVRFGDKSRLVGAWILDPRSFRMRPIHIDLPSQTDKVLKWEFLKNSKEQQLLQITSEKGDDVQLWLLDEPNERFQKILENQLLDISGKLSFRVSRPLIDYEALTFVGWVTDDSIYLKVERQLERNGN